MSDPRANLANLVVTYDRIIVPIHLFENRDNFQHAYGMSLDAIGAALESNPEKYVPVLTQTSTWFKKPGFYDEFLGVCRRVYGRYPVYLPYRVDLLQNFLTLLAKSNTWTSHSASALPTDLTDDWFSEVKRTLPEYDVDRIRDQVASLKGSQEGSGIISESMRLDPTFIQGEVSTMIHRLRIYGHDNLTHFLLNEFYRAYPDFSLLYHILECYDRFLVGPVSEFLGGFGNYNTSDLESMAYLRILPFLRKEIGQLDEANMRLLMNSPGARSPITLETYKANVFLKGGQDVNTLNELCDYAERHRNETRAMSDYRKQIAVGRLDDALAAFTRAAAAYEQINEEVMELTRKERTLKTGIYLVSAGAMFSDIGILLANGFSLPWRLVLAGFKDLVNFVGLKNLDPKRIIEWTYSAGARPWYEQGVPYLYWRKAPDENGERVRPQL